jgi:2-methylcitrate dehydratase PrpD
VLFVQRGFTGEEDIFSGDGNFLEVFCPGKDRLLEWIDNLGNLYDISLTNIKKFCVGSPIQAAADVMTLLVQEYHLTADQVKGVDVHLPPSGARTVNNRTMPDINCQYIMTVILLDGKLTFEAAHSYERMTDPKVREVQSLINLIGDPKFIGQEEKRPGMVRVHLVDGRTVEKLVSSVRGTADNPMTRSEIEIKSMDLLQGILGKDKANSLIGTIWELEKVRSMRELRPLLSV